MFIFENNVKKKWKIVFDGKFLNQDRIRVRICKILKLDPNSVNSESLMIQKLSTRIQ